MKKTLLALFVAASLGATVANAAVITPVNRDAANQGLNDPTAAAPVGGNPGTTVGEQRRIVYQFAADLWGSVLQSNVETRVAASFQPLTCTPTNGVLGSAGAWYVNRDFTGAPLAGTWYHAALANAIAGSNLNSGDPGYVFPDDIEISSRFNSNLGTPGCLETSGWYYGLDGLTPAGKINFLDVVMHEIGHGLGVSGFLNKTTGELFDADGGGAAEPPRSDTYTHRAYDNVQNLVFDDPGMTNALRATAMKTPGRLVWVGANVNAQAPAALGIATLLKATGSLTANYEFGTAAFGPTATGANFNGDVVLVNDGIVGAPVGNPPGPAGTVNDGCEALAPASLTGKIALIERGYCGFELKVANAQAAGAAGAVIHNVASSAAGLITMADDPLVNATIPAIQVIFSTGTALRNALPGVNLTIGTVPGQLAGADSSNRVRLYAPDIVAAGSTFSHYDTTHSPNALMEPSINSDLDGNFRVDLTPAMFKDIGWVLNTGTAFTRNGACNTQVPILQTPGLLPGANLQAADRMCRSKNVGNSIGYRNCMSGYVNRLATAGLIPDATAPAIRACIIR